VSEEGVTLLSCHEQNNTTERICCTERTIQSAMGPQSVLPLMVCCIHGVMLIDSPLEAPHKEIPLQDSCVISNHPHLI